MITIGNTGLQDIFWGSDKVKSMFIGADQVYGGTQPVSARDTWSSMTWYGLTSYSGQYVWSDGTDIYFSSSENQYVLDKATSTWSAKSWNGLSDFYGNNVWSDGTDIYYSDSQTNHYVLNKATSTWSAKTFYGFPQYSIDFSGSGVWTDGTDIYYSSIDGLAQYVLDKATSTWSAKSWNGLTNIDPRNTANLNGKTYYIDKALSAGQTNKYDIVIYELDSTTSTWTICATYNALLSSTYMNYVQRRTFTADGILYMTGGSATRQYKFDGTTIQTMTWNGLTSPNGTSIWNDGNNVYYSSSASQYVLT